MGSFTTMQRNVDFTLEAIQNIGETEPAKMTVV